MDEPRPGIYEQLITEGLDARLSPLGAERVRREPLDPGDAHEAIARHLHELTRDALRAVGGTDAEAVARQVALANRIAEVIETAPGPGARVAAEGSELHEVLPERLGPAAVTPLARPGIPLSTSALLVNGRGQPRIGHEVNAEMASADRVDLLCAFIKWHGVRVVDDALRSFLGRPGTRLRVITTTYMGATERRALDRLAELGAEIRVSYETHSTRLHAKAWLFHRETGYSTGYVGSSNLSRTAMLDGLEWNVRLSAVEQEHLIDTIAATFEDYWNDVHFETYDPSNEADRERLDHALAAEAGGRAGRDQPLVLSGIDVRPHPFQQEILDALRAEREVHGRHRNLVVMATGTGKTVVAGLDFRGLHEAGSVRRLLFVAHREEILAQSRATFRQIMRDGSFGEMLVRGQRPESWEHVFASVQSLARMELDRDLPPDHFDMVIVDEFHHAGAETATYARLLNHVTPRVLLGLTATPERADGQSILGWFGGRIAVEMRLWEALEQGLLAPFQYFGIHDETDLQSIRWKRGSGYDVGELTNLFNANDMRVNLVMRSLRDKVADIGRMRAIGFCVSIAHARYMADQFIRRGIPALAITSESSAQARREALAALRERRVNVLFTVDLLNEGVDIPTIDTVLFLRPTESATVFLQQLGRGLRHADDKPCLTALDFIGHQHTDFRFDLRYRALAGTSRREVADQIAHDFPALPAGCHISLDRVAKEIVLGNVRSALRLNRRELARELRAMGDVSLARFLTETGMDVEDMYRSGKGGWTGLRREAALESRPAGSFDRQLAAAIGRMLYVDDTERLDAWREAIARAEPPPVPSDPRARRTLAMLHHRLWGNAAPVGDVAAGFARLWAEPARRDELLEVLAILRGRIPRVAPALAVATPTPLHVHARYSRDEALAAFGLANPGSVREGVKWIEAEQADVLFVTLNKTEAHYSPTTMYEDRAITPDLFQWESQNATSAASPTGQRYIEHRRRGSSVHLFIRESKTEDGKLGAPPYLYAGTAAYVSHAGDRPMRINWKLDTPLPADIFRIARVAAG